ncbi:hypothetical protein BC941DRAFT_417131 [Chlamydoabsidia padenii]|nr:hypothetical protein BC941DRAFT_417131 [Chlamydoabsidia padenii]
MSIHHDPFRRLYSVDRNLQFFTPEEQRHLCQLGLLKQKEQRQLGKLIKETHQHIQKILSSRQPHSTTTSYSNEESSTTAAVNEFYQHKRTRQLYSKLKTIKEHHHQMMEEQQIRPLENDMERYRQLQVIHGLSHRLDASSQVYDELNDLRLALSSLHRQWKLDRIQHMVNTLATTSQMSTSSSSTLPPLAPPTGHMSNLHNHRWKLSSTSLIGFIKKWLQQSSSPENINHTGTAAGTTTGLTQGHHHRRLAQPHSHFLCSSQEECQTKILQVIQDFYELFEENVHQNEERMHQMYARAFEPELDPMLAEDIQRLCISVSAAPPPRLALLSQPGVSFAFTWNFSLPTRSMQYSFTHQDTNVTPISLSSLILPPTSIGTSTTTYHTNINWIKKVGGIRKKNQDKQQGALMTGQQTWSICLGLLAEHLLYVGQQYYTQCIQDFTQAQQQQTAPFQKATETLATMYRALQIEQSHAVLSSLCTQLKPPTL